MSDNPQQGELLLEASPLPEDAPFLPARMVNEYVYCPRLAYLEWVQGEWAESADTVEGTHAHRRVDREDRPLPSAEALGRAERPRTRAVTLSSRRLGLVARIDLVESDGESVVPVDYKRGKRPHVAAGAYEPERVQLSVQGLLLEENGYRCTEGVLYFAESRERVRVVFDEALRAATRGAIGGLRLVAVGGRIPPPLRDSPKCPRCSLVGICLPDEVNHFHRTGSAPRPIAVRRDEMQRQTLRGGRSRADHRLTRRRRGRAGSPAQAPSTRAGHGGGPPRCRARNIEGARSFESPVPVITAEAFSLREGGGPIHEKPRVGGPYKRSDKPWRRALRQAWRSRIRIIIRFGRWR